MADTEKIYMPLKVIAYCSTITVVTGNYQLRSPTQHGFVYACVKYIYEMRTKR